MRVKLEEGRIIGSYRVLRRIGKGGMGTVYEVEHVELGVHYALKTFTFNPNDEHAVALKAKFLEEGKVLARLKHPNIAHVFDLAFDEQSQLPYFVMDLVTYEDGESYTAEDVDASTIDEELVLQWFTEIAAALDYIHGEGIVHRDIKPANLLIGKDYHVVLTDFGISRVFGVKMQSDVHAEKTMVSKTGRGKIIMGTEKYMAPEVAAGQDATPAADAYALGVMLLRWLTGFYYSDNPGCLSLLSQKKLKWLPVVAKLVAPADQRPANLSALARQVKLSGMAKPRLDDTTKKKAVKSRNGVRILITTIFFLAAAAGAAWFGWQGLQYYERQRKAEQEANEARITQIQKQIEEERQARAKAEADRQRLAAEEQAKKEAAKKAEAERKRKEEAARVQIASKKSEMKRSDDGQPKKNPKRTFVDAGSVAQEEKDYGPIPAQKYEWLRNGDADVPMKERFLLANDALIELVPFCATSFSMANEHRASKGWHKVTITRPFWMSKTCVTVDQWREFAPNDCEDCREVEAALKGRAILCIRLSRKAIDEYCAFLTDKYRVKLPQGYVFRLPTEAEWEYALDHEAVVEKYNKPDVRWWGEFVSINGATVRERFAAIRTGNKILQALDESGWWRDHRYRVGGLSMPTPAGVLDMYGGEDHWMLDKWPRDTFLPYADYETDPLHWKEGWDCGRFRYWEHRRGGCDPRYAYLCHIVMGPDLIGEKAWERPGENVDYSGVKIPMQVKKFDPTKIPGKISKPREAVLRRVGGKDMVFCEIPKGKFNMSNVDGQAKGYHKVELTRPFWMSKFCVTVDEWREFAPNDFKTHAVLTAEKLFPKKDMPVCINNPYHRWVAYCEFLTRRYGNQLPKGYVFRLPTEAEWEWAFIADERGDVRKMLGDFWSHNGRVRNEFSAMINRMKLPKGLSFNTEGFLGDAYIGGRTRMTGFGVCDIVVNNRKDLLMLDTFDTQAGAWKGNDDQEASPADNLHYAEKEIDPVRWAGRCMSHAESRGGGGGRRLRPDDRWSGVAHIVIAPDILKPLREAEVAEFPLEDFGGTFLGDGVTYVDQSSRHWGHNAQKFKRLVSRENVVVAHFDKREDTRGFHTKQEDAPWIMLDLGKKRRVTGLAIDGFWGRTKHLCVWGSNDGEKRTLLAREDMMRKRYRIDLQKKRGMETSVRYLIIGREEKAQRDWFYLDKIVIYGK